MVKVSGNLYKSGEGVVDIWGEDGWLALGLCEQVEDVHNFYTNKGVANVDYLSLVSVGFTQFPHSFTTTIIYKEEDVWKSK